MPRHYLFEGFVLDTLTRELRAADGAPVPLTGRALDTLASLIERRDRLVGKDELLATVWPGRVVEENNLTQAVSALRRALGCAGGEHRFILTVPGRGYRFVARVEEIDEPLPLPSPAGAAGAWRRPMLLALLAGVLAVFGAGLQSPESPFPSARSVATDPARATQAKPCQGGDGEAHRAYLAGRHLLARLSAERLADTVAALNRAIALDPACARAHAALAHLHVLQALGADADPRIAFAQAQAAVAQALSLDPELAEAYLSKGLIEIWFHRDPVRAEPSLRQALARDPESADIHLAYSLVLGFLGRSAEADEHVRRASELDPLSPEINTTRAAYLRHADPAAAVRLLADVLALEPDYWGVLMERARWALAEGRPREAIVDLRAARERGGDNGIVIALLAQAHIAADEPAVARELLDALRQRRQVRYVPATTLAMIHAALGEAGPALDELERADAESDVRMAYFTESRSFRTLRTHPRFVALAARVRGGSALPAPGP